MPERVAADQVARAAALNVHASFIVRAPAGSGKTRLLIQRYLALLATVDEPEEVIAITFTRKAAAEMRERVLSAFAHAQDGAGDLDNITRTLARAALARDAARGWQLLSNASRLRMQTIDALNASITRQMPLAARFGAQPESVDDASALYLEAARNVLAEVNGDDGIATDVRTVLTHLDNSLFVAEKLLADMLRARDHWLRSLPKMHQREALEAALARVCARAIEQVAIAFPVGEVDETLALARFAGQHGLESADSAGVSNVPINQLLGAWPGDTETELPAWLAVTTLLLTKSGTFRKRKGLNKNCGFPPGANASEKVNCDQAKSRMGDFLERLQARENGDRLASALHALRALPPGKYTEQQWEVLGAIVRLLPVATGVLWTVFAAHGQCDFTEIAQSASRALGEDDAPTDLALALDYRLRHLLVDEFQDTSFAQFELLEKLTRGWVDGDGRTLLVVGDPMQSIYRFREAEVGLFLRAMHEGIGDVRLRPLQLTVNFRSVPGVVEWVNRTFQVLMPDREDAIAGRVPYVASVAYSGIDEDNMSAVTWHPGFMRSSAVDVDEGEDEKPSEQVDEASRVIAVIAARQRENPQVDIALLVRNRAHLAEIVPALKAANIAFRAVDIDPLKNRSVVQDLLSLTRALLHPADRIAWLSVLRAPWCGLTLNDLANLTASAHAIEGALTPDSRTVWEMLNDEARLEQLSADGATRARRLRATLAPIISTRRREVLRDVIENIWLALQGPACLADAGELDDALHLLDLLEAEAQSQTGGGHIIDLALLDRRVDRLFAGGNIAADSGAKPVQIMTIHKAKGLEFDTILVPGLHRTPRSDLRRLLVWTDQPNTYSGGRELLLAPIRETGADDAEDAIYRYVRQCDIEKRLHEDVRLLYVAATRAVRQLHLFATVAIKDTDGDETIATPRTGSLLASLWPAVEADFARAMASPKETSAQIAARDEGFPARRLMLTQRLPTMLPRVLHGAATSAPMPATTIDFDWASDTARHIGTVVHAFLQRIAEDGVTQWAPGRIAVSQARIAHELTNLGIGADELVTATNRVTDTLTRTLADPRGRWILDAQARAKSEWRLSGVVNGAVVNIAIDRTFVDKDGVRWIIDFKTGSHEGSDTESFLNNEQARYRSQLALYARIIRALEPDAAASIKLGLYFPMLSGWREWDWSADTHATS